MYDLKFLEVFDEITSQKCFGSWSVLEWGERWRGGEGIGDWLWEQLWETPTVLCQLCVLEYCDSVQV